MTQANEITEEVLKSRLTKALTALSGVIDDRVLGLNPDKKPEDIAKLVYTAGKFVDFVGIVEKATTEERQRAVTICNRLGHRQTAQIIARGSSDV